MRLTSHAYLIVAATLFGLTAPLAKILLRDLDPIMLASLLYLGAFLGLSGYRIARRLLRKGPSDEAPLQRADMPWIAGAILIGGVVAPILLMIGLSMVGGFVASLLMTTEMAATAVIAMVLFREHTGIRLWAALGVMTIASILLTWSPGAGGSSLLAPILIVLAMFCWGLDNNLTRRIANKDPETIVQWKGLVGGSVAMVLALSLGATLPFESVVLGALVLGAFSIGASLVFFIRGLEGVGSARAGVLFGIGPFIGALASLFLLSEKLTWITLGAFLVMGIGASILLVERHTHVHRHPPLEHDHSHTHDDLHHTHPHVRSVSGRHAHPHEHQEMTHEHPHWPDSHHRHDHGT